MLMCFIVLAPGIAQSFVAKRKHAWWHHSPCLARLPHSNKTIHSCFHRLSIRPHNQKTNKFKEWSSPFEKKRETGHKEAGVKTTFSQSWWTGDETMWWSQRKLWMLLLGNFCILFNWSCDLSQDTCSQALWGEFRTCRGSFVRSRKSYN